MATVAAQKVVLRSVALLTVLLLCSCTWYPPNRAHLTVATLNCALAEAPGTAGEPAPAGAPAEAEGSPAPAEAKPEVAEAQPGGAGEAPGAAVELVPPSPPTAEEATMQPAGVEAPAEQPTGSEAEAAAKTERHLAYLARLIKATRADIIVLQGVPGPDALDSLQAKLAKLNWHRKFQGYAFFAGGSGQPSGTVVLSAFPLTSFHLPEAAPGSVLAQMECAEARVRLPGKQELVLYSFRLHREPSLQLEEAKALYDLTLPLRRSNVNLMLAGCLNGTEPYRSAPTDARGTADRALSGADTPSRGDDLVDLDSYLWPPERATGPGGVECCRILLSPEFTTDTYKKVDWYLRRVRVVGDKKAGGEAHRAVVAQFALR
jgi:endonuclease/exonuclease/phosphatase family metal-dependent hydrolase